MHSKLRFIQFLLVGALFFTGCSQKEERNNSVKTIEPEQSVVTVSQDPSWPDSLIQDYIRKSRSPLVVSARTDTSVNIEWLLDRTEKTDTARYMVFHISHDVSDEGGENLRFVTDQWLYIDSASRQLYEYDVAGDSLVKWSR